MGLVRAATACSLGMHVFLALASMLERRRSVSKAPGRRKLIVTFDPATERATPAMKAVRPARAPDEGSRPASGIFNQPAGGAKRRPRIVVDQDVRLRAGGEQGFLDIGVADVARHRRDLGPGRLAQ